jgi:hypothetical protein
VAIPDIVVLVPVPVVIPAGVLVNVQVPVAGKPSKITPPVAMVQVGWVIVPTTGGVGVNGCVLMTTLPDAEEVHPEALVTVKVCVPAASPDTVVLVPVPVVTVPPGVLVNVHVPVAGNPFKITLPVAVVQVGWVMVPITVGVGVTGCALTVTDVGIEIQVLSTVLLTKILCEPADTPANVTEAW